MHRTKSTGRLIAKKFGNTLDRVNWNGHKQERGTRRAPPDLRWPALDNTTKTVGQSISVGCLAMPVECEVPPIGLRLKKYISSKAAVMHCGCRTAKASKFLK